MTCWTPESVVRPTRLPGSCVPQACGHRSATSAGQASTAPSRPWRRTGCSRTSTSTALTGSGVSQPAIGPRAANDITYIRTHEGWLYLAAVIDLFSRKVVGWSMQPRMHTRLALDALMMAVWRRRPAPGVVVHSDQGSQFSSQEWRSFLEAHELVPSMSRRGNCYDNAVAESVFHLLKTERIRRKTYTTRADARQDIFDYVEMFYNPRRRHANNGMLSPDQFERAAS